MIPSPPKLEDLKTGEQLIAGLGYSTIIADIDFETYSEAGYVWNSNRQHWDCLPNAAKAGLPAIGAAKYAEHPSTEVLCCSYNLKDGIGIRTWIPGMPLPTDLFKYVLNFPIEAWNASFEYWIWSKVCTPRYGWPVISMHQFRCAAAKARAYSLPGGLDACAKTLGTESKKDPKGKRLIQLLCCPHNPTKKNPDLRIRDNKSLDELIEYNKQDIVTEAEVSSLIPDLSKFELEFWKCDQIINRRGVQIDIDSINAAIKILEAAYEKYNNKLKLLTNNIVNSASEVQKLLKWVNSQGVQAFELSATTVEKLLIQGLLPPLVKEALLIRQMIGSAAVKKLYAMRNQACMDGRLHDLFIYHSARTGRAAGAGVQPQNLPNSGPPIIKCHNCKKYSNTISLCTWCLTFFQKLNLIGEWNPETVHEAINIIKTESLEQMEYIFGDAIETISGCLRGMFISKPGHDLICSDYSAIEAVVLAEIAGESWRQEVFRTHGKIYEMSASKITGIPFQEFLDHKEKTGQHHPTRKTIGKVAELASGYQGWIGAWKQFGADKFFNDQQIKDAILSWRAASPAIVELWGGQERNWESELYGLEGMAISAVMNPGIEYTYRNISYLVRNDVLYCHTPSGGYLTYHKPRLSQATPPRRNLSLSYEGWNTNPKKGKPGWIRISTYGGMLCENVVQKTARDILANAIINLEQTNYPVVLHVHDEIVCEIPEGKGSIEEFETIMNQMPQWAKEWPIKASGGWRAKRYSK